MGPGSCWLRRLAHTERAAAHQAELRRRAAARGLAEGADGRATGAIVRIEGLTGPWAHALNGTYDLWEVNDEGSPAFLKRGSFPRRRGGGGGVEAGVGPEPGPGGGVR